MNERFSVNVNSMNDGNSNGNSMNDDLKFRIDGIDFEIRGGELKPVIYSTRNFSKN